MITSMELPLADVPLKSDWLGAKAAKPFGTDPCVSTSVVDLRRTNWDPPVLEQTKTNVRVTDGNGERALSTEIPVKRPTGLRLADLS